MLDRASAFEIVEWTIDRFGPKACVAASMTDAVLIDLATRVEPSIEVVFIDTGYHFQETLATVEVVRHRYQLDLRVMRVEPPSDPVWRTDPTNCCSPLKVAQLELALRGKKAWMSGVRRADSPDRARAPVIELDRRGLAKVNPLVRWSDDNVNRYIRDNDVPVNPLATLGYRSIGCRPCTRPVAEGEPARAGRWPGTDKTECGLHG